MYIIRKFATLYLLSIPLLSCIADSSYQYFLGLTSSGSASIEEHLFIRLDESVFRENGHDVIPYVLGTFEGEIGLLDCGIHKEDTSIQDKYCILNINEIDLLGTANNLPLALEYNVPRETCEYASFFIPWHFNQPTGVGPERITRCTYTPDNTNGNGDSEEVICIKEGDHREECRDGSAIGTHNNCDNGWIREDSEGDTDSIVQNFCPYDYSERGLANCCVGEYTLSDCEYRSNTCPDGEKVEWGGDISECIGGPARVNNWETSFEQTGIGSYPIPRIFPTWERGIKEVFELEKPTLVSPFLRSTTDVRIHPQYSSIGIANYYEDIEDLQWNSSDADNLPDLFKTVINPNVTSPQRTLLGYPYFTLECLDSNKETLHRVHLVIREWNTLEDFWDFKDSNGSIVSPDVTGLDGTDCDYYDSDEFGNNDCNDLFDLDDFINQNLCPIPGARYPCVDYEGA